MKNIQNLAMLSAVIAFASCNSNKPEPQTDTEPQKETITTEMDTAKQAAAASQQAKPNETLTIEGTVKEIANGKDGYTASILTSDNQTYKATISHSNLKDAKQYRTFNTNEIVKVTGDSWKMGEENHITVREIQ